MAIQLLTLASDWETKPVTQDNVLAFLKWFATNTDSLMLKKAVKQIKAVKVGPLPSNPSALMGIDLRSHTLYVTERMQWGENSLERVTSSSELRHELGHVIWQSLRTKPAAQAFVKAVLEESKKGKYISSYQETMGKRFYAKKVSQDIFAHEAFAEWVKFGPAHDRGCPKQHMEFRKLFK